MLLLRVIQVHVKVTVVDAVADEVHKQVLLEFLEFCIGLGARELLGLFVADKLDD